MAYLFSSESVSEGHPDKVADQISDALLDQFLAYDDHAHCAIETFCTTGQVVIMGEVRSNVYVDLQTIARKTIKKIGYTKSEYQFDGDSCGVLTAIHEQSDDINRGVSREEDDESGCRRPGYDVRLCYQRKPKIICRYHLTWLSSSCVYLQISARRAR